MRSMVRVGSKGKGQEVAARVPAGQAAELDSRVELIQALIPLGLEAVNELLQQEVTALAGGRYQRGGGVERSGVKKEGGNENGDSREHRFIPGH